MKQDYVPNDLVAQNIYISLTWNDHVAEQNLMGSEITVIWVEGHFKQKNKTKESKKEGSIFTYFLALEQKQTTELTFILAIMLTKKEKEDDTS